MRLLSTLIIAALVTAPAFAQQTQRSSNPNGVQIQGNTNIKAANQDVKAVVSGQNNEAKNTTGAIKGGTQIQGNTNISAAQKGAAAVASGKNNAAANEAGVIGSK